MSSGSIARMELRRRWLQGRVVARHRERKVGRWGGGGALPDRQPQREGGAETNRTVTADRARHGFGQALDDGKTEAGGGLAAGWPGAEPGEFLEQLLLIRLADAG